MLIFKEMASIFKRQVLNDKKTNILKKWKQAGLAIVFALIFSGIIISIKGENPINVFIDIYKGATRNSESWKSTFLYFSMFTLAGLSIIVGFKAGLFNIGVGGQMLISGATMSILAIKTHLPWAILIFIGIFIAAASASISGVLKAKFNIHEVVSTILINWIFFYITQYMLHSGNSYMDGVGSTKEFHESARMLIDNSPVLPAFIVTGILLILFILIFKYTKIGYALKAVGENANASKYAGVNTALQLSIGMAFSGICVGALSAVNYMGKFGSMSHAVSESLPSIGFQGISVALISFNSMYGLIPAAMFWAILTSGTDFASIVHPDVPKEIISLMNGLIIYSISISIIFIRFKPIKVFWKMIIYIKSDKYKQEKIKYKKAKKTQRQLFITSLKKILSDKKNDDEIIKNINSLKIKEKDIKNKISLKNKIFKSSNKKPIFFKFSLTNVNWNIYTWKYLFINSNYKKEKTFYFYNQNLKNEKLELELEEIIIQRKILNNELINMLIKNIKKQQKDSIQIIHNAQIKKVNNIVEDFKGVSKIGIFKQKIKLKKKFALNYELQYALLIHSYKSQFKKIDKKNIVEKQKIKDSLNKEINNLKNINKKELTHALKGVQ